jgi:chromosomal replication initiator protein
MQTQFPTNLQSIWQAIAEHIAAQVSKDTYQRWFKAVAMTAADETDITLTVPNNIYQLWIESNYLALVQSSVASVLGGPRNIQFQTGAEEPAPKTNGRHAPEADDETAIEVNEPAPRPAVASAGKASTKGQTREVSAEAAHAAAVASGMNPRNTFSTFVVGANNQFAHAAALAVSQAPARTYNPLFVYGGVGLGKTHLMHAIGQHVAQRGNGSKVMYLSSEKFTNEFIDGIQNNSLVKFRKRYRQADLLLIDDIQFFSGKERSQEEFFHTFNTLFDGHKQIVLSSDRPPAEIANLEQRLVSRFEWGLTAELQPPDIETRLAILRKKAESLTIKLESNILEFLAQRIRTNVRRLEGALMRVASFVSLSDTAIGTDTIEHLLKDILHEESRRTVTMDLIQRKVAEHFDVRVADMTSKRRPANIAFPRQIAMYLARELTKNSLAEIGEAFGGRDHGTVLHAHRLVQERMRNEEKLRQTVSFLETHLNR